MMDDPFFSAGSLSYAMLSNSAEIDIASATSIAMWVYGVRTP
jgi:hypothetical protein